jgi:hypothetical protein
MEIMINFIRFEDLTMEQLCGFVKTIHKCDVKQGLTRDEIIVMIKEMNEKMINEIKKEEEDYESANCEICCENYLLDKLEVKDDKFYCRVCFEEDNRECCENCHEKTSRAEWIDYIGNNILYCDECYERHQKRIEEKCSDCNFRQRCPNKNICSICIEDSEYMEEDMGECPKCDCAVKRKDLAWRIGYYLDICAKCDNDE